MDTERERALIKRAADGDEVALKVLLTRSHPLLCGYVAERIPANLSRLVDIEDIVQDTHVRVFQRIGTLRSNRPKSFRRWLNSIALGQLRNAIRRHRAAKRGGERVKLSPRKMSIEDSTIALLNRLAGPGRTPSQSFARGEAIEAVQAAISALPKHYQEALRLVHIEGRTIQEAALTMGRTERTIHGLCRRGLKQLEGRLESRSWFQSSAG